MNRNILDNKKKIVYIILTIFFIICGSVCIVLYAKDSFDKDEEQDKYDNMATMTKPLETTKEPETSTEPADDPLAGIPVEEKNLDWNAIKAENEHIYAWIYIPGTKVDYPILQHPTDDSYYLDHNIDGSKGLPGTIFSQSLNSKDFTDPNTVLYGHNMKNGSMFASLHNFEDNVFFDENMYIYIYTPEKTYVYKIFAAYNFNNKHLLYEYDCSTKEKYEYYLSVINNVRDMTARRREDVKVTTDDCILTLSTCLKNSDDTKRYLVQGVLLGTK